MYTLLISSELSTLHQVSIPQSVIENTTFSFNIENTTGYPLLPQFTWFYNEVVISPDSTNPNISVYPYITFSFVSRSQSGNYSMIASNELHHILILVIILSPHLVGVKMEGYLYHQVEDLRLIYWVNL